ncbi:glycosyltransferase [Cyclobacterium sp. 1_MG-2023]|uniref:glycosyltransferase family 2 protein n=1 Tax=Cyclobacterium sp. 1_MG-2023 TaxID=3062681 RepID=UPI0026E1D782|nr:glycosyltransferase [Cyclobacterium sp. 1_MG-2023]MDO6436234.1 glycosyltransferase [Cyclobacterium sp. 1_MG-2023]
MERIPQSPPKIQPIPPFDERPLWSIMIPVYNCSEFIIDSLNSVLAQDLGENLMQIEVIDDCSTDADVESLVKKIGGDRVTYYRQQKNVGSLRNFETCINRSKGKLVHLLHGDDRVKEGFYDKISDLFKVHPEAGAAFCRYHFIDGNGQIKKEGKFNHDREGILKDALHIMSAEQPTQYVATVVKREVYEKLGSFYGVVFGEDWEMWVRIAKNYPIAYSTSILAEYRRHIGSISYPEQETGQNVIDLAQTILNIEKQLPEDMKHIMWDQKLACKKSFIKSANLIWQQISDRKKAHQLIKKALSIQTSDRNFYYLLFKLYIKIIFKIKKNEVNYSNYFSKKITPPKL